MALVVITPPESLVSAPDAKAWAPVLAGDDDARVGALLIAAQSAIEPPNGWVGRAFGMQTLEARLCGFLAAQVPLECPPVREVISVACLGPDGVEYTLPGPSVRLVGAGTATAFLVPAAGGAWPSVSAEPESVRIRFRAGYASDDPEVVPVKHAIVLAAMHLRSLTTQDLALRSRTTDGVGSRTWTVSDAAEKLVHSAVEGLLAPFRTYRS